MITELMDRFADFLFVGQMGRFEKDFKKLKKILGLADSVGLPNKDDKRANTSPNFVDKHLTQLAKRNLKKWYSEDYEFLEILKGNELIS